ncbi:uncharacterized protein LOC117802944 [Ailuropoda melanoleuca]|uniref:uncharacterized protein LOC117802944 n=1 Tax=Ailuropoda melanoleuca TaxID=9646 RepID=UPI001494B01B|nr:uncharacterized protein LOC117802944 [Ailuropoda melanoleuca]
MQIAGGTSANTKSRPRRRSRNRGLASEDCDEAPPGRAPERVPTSLPPRRTSQNPSAQVASARGRLESRNEPARISESRERGSGATKQPRARSPNARFATRSSERLASSSVCTEKEKTLFSAEGRNFKLFLSGYFWRRCTIFECPHTTSQQSFGSDHTTQLISMEKKLDSFKEDSITCGGAQHLGQRDEAMKTSINSRSCQVEVWDRLRFRTQDSGSLLCMLDNSGYRKRNHSGNEDESSRKEFHLSQKIKK